jgi:hypothetical protein
MGLAGGLTGGSEMRSESSPHYLHLLETALITEDIDRKRFLPRQSDAHTSCAYWIPSVPRKTATTIHSVPDAPNAPG